LQKTGLFRWARHSSYTGMLLIFTAIGGKRRHWLSLAIMLVFPTAVLLYGIRAEEMALSEGIRQGLCGIQQGDTPACAGIY
jgi:protein-S-isoprenylcysteine O-methyltransferase Ste14